MSAVTLERTAIKSVGTVGSNLRGLSGSPNLLEYRHVGVEEARAAMRPMLGRVITGNVSFLERYYEMSRTHKPPLDYRLLPKGPFHEHNFRGVFTRLVNIKVALPLAEGGERDTHRFCLQVAPLSRYVDDEWQQYYLENGMENQLQHPFRNPDRAGRSVWIPVNYQDETFLDFPETPAESMSIINRTFTRGY